MGQCEGGGGERDRKRRGLEEGGRGVGERGRWRKERTSCQGDVQTETTPPLPGKTVCGLN